MAVSNSFTPQSDCTQRTNTSKKSSGKFGAAFRKVGKYLKEQAHEQSYATLYLSPRDPNYGPGPQYKLVQKHGVAEYLGDDPVALPYGVIPPVSSNNTPTPSNFTSGSMSSESPSETGILRSLTRHQYASDNILQSYDVLIPDRKPQSNNQENPGYFLIFIHGGYFRDPKQTSKSFYPTISLLESSAPHIRDRITGYASLNYRLSAHPGHPQDPSTTPPYTLNNTRWPDQPNDILAALRHLQSHYSQSKRYILSGHSVGATLSFIAALRCAGEGLVAPTTVMGICGIYDFPRIHRTNDGYEYLTKGAMDPDKYVEASPALVPVKKYLEKWVVPSGQGVTGKRGIVLAHPASDELVGTDQTRIMVDLFREGEGEGRGKVIDGFGIEVVDEVQGTHWDILENGELARCLESAVQLSA